MTEAENEGGTGGRRAATKTKKKKKAARPAGTVKIRMIGSLIGCTDKQRANVRGLGLRRMHQVVEREDTPQVRGMIAKVPHLVSVVSE
jgi:large subunit ribosomal protein L30